MSTLVYHSLLADTPTVGTSPFDSAVLQVARSGPVRIVSPYIGVAYLERIIGISGQWRLISDVQEWLGSLSVRARPRAWGFIRENIESIHHCPSVHAKAVISDSLAMMGSANFTSQGILGRTEMGILIDEPPMVAELGAWFEDLWRKTSSPLVDEASAYVQWLDEEASRAPTRRQKFSLSGAGKLVRARLVKLHGEEVHPVADAAQLDLGAVAKALVVEEQKRYDSINQAIEAAIDALTQAGSFTLGDAVRQVRAGFESATPREIYLLLVQYCANHARSAFAPSTVNRLVLSDEGRFSQSTRETVPVALATYDRFLAYLIAQLDFDASMELPAEHVIERVTGVLGWSQVLLVGELIDCGLLELEDVAGEMSHYRLAEDFEWEGRYRLFTAAHQAWIARKASRPARSQPVRASSVPAAVSAQGQETALSANKLIWDDISRTYERDRYMPESNVKAEYEHVRVDSALAYVLEKLLAGQTLEAPTTKALVKLIFTGSPMGYKADQKLLEGMLRNRDEKWPPVLSLERDTDGAISVTVNPGLSWDALEGYPTTRAVCAQFLGMGDAGTPEDASIPSG